MKVLFIYSLIISHTNTMYFDNIHSLLPMPSPFGLLVLPNASPLISFGMKNYPADCASCYMCMTIKASSQLSQSSSYQPPVAPQLRIGSVFQTFFAHPRCNVGWLGDEQGSALKASCYEIVGQQTNPFTSAGNHLKAVQFIHTHSVLFRDASCSHQKIV